MMIKSENNSSENKKSSTLIGLIITVTAAATLTAILASSLVTTFSQEVFAAAPCYGPGGCTPQGRGGFVFYPEQKHHGKLAYQSEADLERQDKTLDKYNSSADSTTGSLDTTASASLTTQSVNVAVTMDQEESEEKERQQIKEWHNRVFKDIKSNYECLSK